MSFQKTTVKQSLQVLNVDWKFCFHGFTYCISRDFAVFVHFDLFFQSFQVLVYILQNVTNFLRNEHFVYIFDGEKTMPIFRKIKFVCKLMHFEHNNAENVAMRR